MKLRAGLSFVSAALFATAASAQYLTDFEAPTFTSGPITGQDLWNTAANSATARILSDAEIASELNALGLNSGTTVHSGSQALMVSGAGVSSATIRSISGLETQNQVVLDIWTRPLTGSTTGNIFLTLEDSSGDRAAAFRFGPAQSIDYGTTVAGIWQASGSLWDSDTWYHFTLSVDYVMKTYDFALNGTKVNADPIPFYNAASDNLSQIRIFRGANQAGMIVDSMSVTPAPEPATVAFLLLGSAAILGRRSRRS